MNDVFEQVTGKKTCPLPLVNLLQKAADFSAVHVDLGTGDGLFVWRLAKERPGTLVVGIDAARDSLAEGSARAAKKPARGGTPNALFVCMNVLQLPDGLTGFADSVSINFPWGSLLKAVVEPEQPFVYQLKKLIKKGGRLDVHINLYVFQNAEERENLVLPPLDENHFLNRLQPALEKGGFVYQSHQFVPAGAPVGVASTWGGRLTRNSKRDTLSMCFLAE